MGLVKDTPDWLLERLNGDHTCHLCGECDGTVLWDGLARGGVDGLLLLCDDCVLSMCGGMLNDLVLSGDRSFPGIVGNLQERLKHVIGLRLENEGHGVEPETARRYRKLLEALEEH